MRISQIVLMVAVVAGHACATLPFSDGFDSYPAGQTFLSGSGSWQADTSSVHVVTTPSTNTPNSACVAGGTLSNLTAQGGAAIKVWTVFDLWPVLGLPPAASTTNGATLQLYFATNGLPVLATPHGALPLGYDIQGMPIAAVDTNHFVHLIIYQDFTTHLSAILLNGQVITQDVVCLTAGATFNRMAVQSLDQACYLDNVAISTQTPASVDGNGDGLSDALELQTYGYVARTNLTVGPGLMYTTLQAAITAARARDTIVVMTNALAETLVIDHAVTVTGMSFTNAGSCTVSAGGVLHLATGLVNTGALTVAGDLELAASLSAASASFGGAGVVNGAGASLVVTAQGVSLSGSFAITAAQWNNGQAQSALPFSEGFESYAAGMSLGGAWYNGWGVSNTAVAVSTPVQAGSRAAQVTGVVSNRIQGASASKVWTDFYLRPRLGSPPDARDTNAATLLMYVDTNGWLNLFNAGRWDVLSNGVLGAAVVPMTEGGYGRVSILVDCRIQQAAVFLNGQLLRQCIPFPRGLSGSGYNAFQVENEDGNAYVDGVQIGSALPSGLSGDADSNGLADGYEVDRYGLIGSRGVFYLIR